MRSSWPAAVGVVLIALGLLAAVWLVLGKVRSNQHQHSQFSICHVLI